MLESIASSLLTKYLGDYVEGNSLQTFIWHNKGLDSKNLQVSVSSGNVQLKSLNLKKSALKDLELPIVIKEGLSRFWYCLTSRIFGAVINEDPVVQSWIRSCNCSHFTSFSSLWTKRKNSSTFFLQRLFLLCRDQQGKKKRGPLLQSKVGYS